MSDIKNYEGAEPAVAATAALINQVIDDDGDKPSTPASSVDAEVKNEQNKNNGANSGEARVIAGEDEETPKEDNVNHRGDPKRGSTKDKAQYQKRPSKSKFDPNVEEVTNDPDKIRNQVEFYFSDSNLPTDKFMWTLVDGPTNLPVKISKICTFGRMRKYQPYSAVVAALRDSITLDVSGPEGLEEVKRKAPYNPEKKDDREPRTVYAKGFGEELPSTQFDTEAFFAPYGPINCVRLRRHDDKEFKGSVLVEFQDEETAQKFLSLDPKPLWQGKHELKIMSHLDYKKEKNEGIRKGDIEPNKTRRPFRGRGKSSWGAGSRHDRDRDPDDWKKRRDEDQKSGFRDNKRDRDNRQRGGRGGRGRGRGDRRNNDRNVEREERERAEGENENSEAKKKDLQEGNGRPEEHELNKRPREDDDGGDEAPAKRLDHKEEVGTDAS